MTALIAWGASTLVASTLLMLVILGVRGRVRHWFGPRLAYALWILPAVRMDLPPIPADFFGTQPTGVGAGGSTLLFAGPIGDSGAGVSAEIAQLGGVLPLIWLAGFAALLGVYAARHLIFCHRLRVAGIKIGEADRATIIATSVPGPLAFGLFRKFIAVPDSFLDEYNAIERELVIAHERAHHARGDLIANWISLVVLAAHWWNPVAWAAIRAFREDQEFAADADVMANRTPDILPHYAHVLAKAAGIGALPVCNLNARSHLKGRLMMLAQRPRSTRRLLTGGLALAMIGGAAIAATTTTVSASSANGAQAVTIGVKPDGDGGYALIVGNIAVAPGAPLPGGATLPADFSPAGGCDLKRTARPFAMVIKGMGDTRTYTVMCASAAPAPIRATLAEGLASLRTMRGSVATQPASTGFPETERSHAIGAIDNSINEVEAAIGAAN